MIAEPAIISSTIIAGDALFGMTISAGSEPIDIDVNGETFIEGVTSDQDMDVQYENGDPVGSKNGAVWEIPDLINSAAPIQTGQTVSYATGDDGDEEAGWLTNFTTLPHNNYFGNTNRFTDILGGQTYADDIVIDWATWSKVDGSFIMWRRSWSGTADWATSEAAAVAVSIGTFTTGWRLPNRNEFVLIASLSTALSAAMNYAPFNIVQGATGTHRYWSGSTNPRNTSQAVSMRYDGILSTDAKTSGRRWIPCRIGNISEL